MDKIAYKKGYKYQLVEDYQLKIPISPPQDIDDGFYLQLDSFGLLTVKRGYAWDGPSGPTVDTANFMRGSLIHDALYQLMRNRYLDSDRYRDVADHLLKRICQQDGMSSVRAWWVYWGVRLGAAKAASAAMAKIVLHAPR